MQGRRPTSGGGGGRTSTSYASDPAARHSQKPPRLLGEAVIELFQRGIGPGLRFVTTPRAGAVRRDVRTGVRGAFGSRTFESSHVLERRGAGSRGAEEHENRLQVRSSHVRKFNDGGGAENRGQWARGHLRFAVSGSSAPQPLCSSAFSEPSNVRTSITFGPSNL